MKARIASIIAAALLFACAAGEARAAGFQIGAIGWYTWWKPSFEKWMLQGFPTTTNLPRLVKDYSFPQSPLFGPVLGIDFNDRVNLTAIFTGGKYRFRASVLTLLPFSANGAAAAHPDVSINKYDLDTALNITLNRFVKIIIGVKYQNYSFTKTRLMSMSPTWAEYSRDSVSFNALSGGFGFGFTFRLVQNLYLIWSLSARYQHPFIILRNNTYLLISTPVIPMRNRYMPNYNSVAGNSTLSLAYVIEAISTTITAGFRYQYLYTFGRDMQDLHLSTESDHFYGVTLAAVYSYQAPEKEPLPEEKTE
ncbi:MAG TPA: outer membrane beta-barrel protein [Spirochaetota bacterium]|nr:outer membrane beta-barrel protein [Spirochaetota bacterium]HOD15767.1 outer membrane beta-barrel protein [Spirochaetota bacterium]HPG52569.1 outer membrane beta-barrel protein [Spirochaetota bacterium]HPN12984.1 outer membrane beta-barrel protein [Spirochaetota bacterium]